MGRVAPPKIDDGELSGWCRHWLGSEPAEVLFRGGHLSAVIGLHLADGRRVVVKARRPEERLTACVEVQRRLCERGYPAPRPIAGPAPLAGLAATAEGYRPGGAPLPPGPGVPRQNAEAFAELVAQSPAPADVASLDPSPPWVGWEHASPGLWPAPDELDDDLNAHPEPWLDGIGVRIRQRLLACALPKVIGHGDWQGDNVKWLDGRLHAVHDWDSVLCAPEAALAGVAATAFEETAEVAGATIDESEAFLASYAAAQNHAWSHEEREVAYAAGLWLLAFNAKKEAVLGNRSRAVGHLEREASDRLRLAGLGRET